MSRRVLPWSAVDSAPDAVAGITAADLSGLALTFAHYSGMAAAEDGDEVADAWWAGCAV